MRLSSSTGLYSRGIARRKMKLATCSALTIGIFYFTVAAILPRPGESRSKRYLKEGYVQSLRRNIPYESTEADYIVDKADLRTLRLVHVIFRHGDRTPIERYPKDPYNSPAYWPEGWGYLTDRGKQMQYKLGQYIRRRYDGFLGKKYRHEEIFVQSSDKDRTIMSAMANLAGMWPPVEDLVFGEGGRQQFVPVHSISASLDNKIAFTKSCPRYEKELLEVNSHPTEVAFNQKNEELYKYLSDSTGLTITSYANVSDIYDILWVQSCHNLTLPTWALKDSIYPDKLRISADKWIRSQTFTFPMRKLRAAPLITEFVRNMKRTIGDPGEDGLKVLEALFGTPAAKFYVYSGHDTTLSTILDSFGLFNGHIPPYGASLYIELHEENSKHFVKIFHRPDLHGHAEELELKNCISSPCLFEDFMKSMTAFIMDEKEWENECALPQPNKTQS